ncbi:MAG TPA: DUF3152 domain-containing protein [Kineosporiaceae bacterium]
MSTTRIRGAHRRPRPGVPPDPARVGGPSRWAVSVGVLAVVAAICGAGAFVLRSGGGDGGLAAVSSSPGAAGVAPTPWTARTLQPADAPSGNGTTYPPVSPTVAVSSPTVAVSSPTVAVVSPTAATPAGPGGATAAGADGVAATDRAAGIATTAVATAGSGHLLVVPGRVPAPGAAPSMRVGIEVEGGIGADGAAFAAFVMATLNDARGWGHGGTLSFARTDGPADFRVILASPATTAVLCGAGASGRLPAGTTSCGGGDRAVLTMDRWMNAIPDYGGDRTTYRRYLINHEVGHVLGHTNAYCTPGHLAPVMVQQNEGLHGCLPNAWPFPLAARPGR